MTTAIFDTLKASRDLKAAGVDARQAEAIVTTMAEAFDDAVATKANLAEVKAELKADIAAVKAELKTDIADKAHAGTGRAESGFQDLQVRVRSRRHHLAAQDCFLLLIGRQLSQQVPRSNTTRS